MTYLRALLLTLFLAVPAAAEQPYDLIFRMGTLDGLPRDEMLLYGREVAIDGNAEYADRNTGGIELRFEPEDMARLRFVKDTRHRNLGQFPATVGNPVIMYFVETVLRDVAQEAGGSPFYIRNRIKDSLVQDAPVNDATLSYNGRDIAVKTVTLRPFENDKNREKLRGYADLALTFTMSEDVPGWYLSLEASAPGDQDGLSYRNALTLHGMEAAQ
ncbi:hypothetical protein [Roseovarius aestuarii]|uniref:DUF3108 domain-containing protein n=2 Tax=Roseovarius aestuarii TaxID=475083 RepID=A0A1X7BWS7_9RHOB|nr:hypothetical protein [Roseovarius aestuarii]SMC13940.1 hypothetical protein ROA7745_03802 [Roseovarius aestuarii]